MGSSNEKKASVGSSKYGMVSTASPEATEAGVKILEKGGNAVDAAVAAALCLGVTEPQASGIGGQTMAIIHLKEGRSLAIDGSSRAPFNINANPLTSKPLKLGLIASTVPSTPAVLGYMLETYGSLELKEVLEPSIVAAEEGFKLTYLQHSLLKKEASELIKDPLVKRNFFKYGMPLAPEERVHQPELAFCMKKLKEAGWRDFYLGEVAQRIIKDMEEREGIINKIDLSQIPFPVERPLLEGQYRNLSVKTFPPPGAGRALLQILNILENFSPQELDSATPQGASILALAFRAALRDRERMPVDPALYQQIEEKLMVEKKYATGIAERIKSLSLDNSPFGFIPPGASGETTHLSVVDMKGNAVGITQSIELVFGCKRACKDLGFFYNNYMRAFNYKDATHPYYLLPGNKPWSSVAPTLIFKDGLPLFLLGTPGSERISTTLAQIIVRYFDLKNELDVAISAPRFHVSSRGRVQIENKRFKKEVAESLLGLGLQIINRGSYSFYLGCVQGVKFPDKKNGLYIGVADPRRDGVAKGPIATS